MDGVGASEAAAALGISPWSAPLEVFARKLGLEPDPGETDAMRLGRAFEPVIMAELARDEDFIAEYGRVIMEADQRLLASDEHDFIRCTPDAWAHQWVEGGLPPSILAECKRTGDYEAYRDGTAPMYVWVQVQQQMYVTGEKRCIVAALVPRGFRWICVERDDEFISNALVPGLVGFWQRVQDREPPATDASEATVRALAVLYPEEDPEQQVTLGGEFIELDEKLQRVTAQRQELERQEKAAKNRFKAAIGDAAAGLLPSGVVYTFRTQTRKAHEVKASTFRVLRRKKAKDDEGIDCPGKEHSACRAPG
jgi:predicted phage-related endonuclease